jgi:hypothetical protein
MAGACAAAFKAWLVYRARNFAQCWGISLVGFLAGQALAENAIGLPLLATAQVGDVYWAQAGLLAWLLLFVVGRTRLW